MCVGPNALTPPEILSGASGDNCNRPTPLQSLSASCPTLLSNGTNVYAIGRDPAGITCLYNFTSPTGTTNAGNWIKSTCISDEFNYCGYQPIIVGANVYIYAEEYAAKFALNGSAPAASIETYIPGTAKCGPSMCYANTTVGTYYAFCSRSGDVYSLDITKDPPVWNTTRVANIPGIKNENLANKCFSPAANEIFLPQGTNSATPASPNGIIFNTQTNTTSTKTTVGSPAFDIGTASCLACPGPTINTVKVKEFGVIKDC